MSTIKYRDWEIWTNIDFFDEPKIIDGYYLIRFTPALMQEQTIEFLREKVELIRQNVFSINNKLLPYLSVFLSFEDKYCINKHEQLNNQSDIKQSLNLILEEIEALSLCLDFPLNCYQIEYIIPPLQPINGKVLIATRKNLNRGLTFEIEERGSASNKIVNDYDYYLESNTSIKAASKHYLTGLTLLTLEDMYPGLIDAAFMQFYQGCEILCGDNFNEDEAKKYIAKKIIESEKLQIIIHHLWQVRHSYFGHGNSKNNLDGNNDNQSVYLIAKQVLVARWLCKKLLDIDSPSMGSLIREMRFYNKGISEDFRGEVKELETNFRLKYGIEDKRRIKIFNSKGEKIKEGTD
ncbi:hypothetical protein HGA88_01835 [Candidatus Roizmanbacteria bacterium]|nr:hypothetical protein [Candidatus Roizmanbacteria bacterium]